MSDDDSNVIVLHDGTKISTRTGRPVRDKPNGVAPGYIALPSNAEAIREVTRVRKRLADLPDIPSRMNVIGAIASYSLFGLDTHEIAHAVGCTERQVSNIMMTQAYTDLIMVMHQNIVETQQEDVRGLINQHARTAVTRVVQTLDSDDDSLALAAAKDILDRSGHRPADVVEHRMRVEGGLTIEYIRKHIDEDEPLTIDMQVEDQ